MSDVAPIQSPVPAADRSFPSSSGSSMSPELECNIYKEKVEHFKILIRKLQEENQGFKLRKESTATVSKLLQETKQEVAALQNKCSLFDAIIRTLQSRLESNGLSSDVVPHEGEQYIPGQSKTLLDNLSRENKRLRNLVRSRSGDPEEYAKLQQSYEELERDCSEIRLFTGKQHTRIAELEQVLKSSDNEKDRTINALREEINSMTNKLTSRDTLCTTLSEETRMLQKQLGDVARQCQELAKRLQEQGHNTDKIVQTALKAGISSETEDRKTTREENISLKQKLKEVSVMNKRWQDYNNQREVYVKTLQREIGALEERATKTASTQGNTVPHDTQVEMNQILDEGRRLTRALDEQKQSTSCANNQRDRHKQDLENANCQITKLRSEIQQLKEHLEAGGADDTSETINALKTQIRICTEDFESERKDRERAITKISRLERDLERVRKENEALKREKSRLQPSPHVQPQFTDPFYHYQTTGPHGNFSNEDLAARGVSRATEPNRQTNIDRYNVIDGADDADKIVYRSNQSIDKEQTRTVHDDNYVSLNTSSISSKERSSLSPINSIRNSGDSSTAVSSSPRNSPMKTDDNLQCPRCNKEFTSTEHPELLEHLENC